MNKIKTLWPKWAELHNRIRTRGIKVTWSLDDQAAFKADDSVYSKIAKEIDKKIIEDLFNEGIS